MDGVELHQELKNLCVNTVWKYAVFWKLNHQDRMTLTCEDAYCDNTNDNSRDGRFATDHLGLEIVKMSYRVYSIGEGIIGQVAAAGKHVWKSGHQLVNSSCSLDEHLDGWRSQFKAGIRTVVVIGVAPHGVIQLGSLNTIAEDLKLVNYSREIFSSLQSSLMESTDCSPCVTDLSTSSGSGRFHEHVKKKDRTMKYNMPSTWTKVETINNQQESEDPLSDFIQSTLDNDQYQNLSKTETNESFKFPVGCELYEALGPAFCKQKNSFEWDTATTETVTVNEMPEETLSSKISGSEHLLEAVVANGSMSQSAKPVSRASDLLTSGSGCYSFDMTTNLQAYTSAEGSCEPPAKVGKKRARPGQSGRPRPRDRQLIQDRIKELRDLVPNGSKCSIDSLLERTIKHMLFMQCVTKHADKIDKCAEFKLAGKEKGVQGPHGHNQGSSWAMEVGDNLKLCPIIVENIGVNGQMLIEMMCDECVQFLEMTEAIRRLGLTILKGATDVHGDKTWMCFVVEGENNRNIHRVDILWSLIQILQLKTNT
ncbi:hypothetical protein L2E82_13051 [Cichorium intybus]|uniref:Uncharacterized protein n=1 Tax=Cichorium intybus TaxID=13427 RepID=A0ACB9GIY6_CICIN|nr:hypothetical protein L2E82_13051 [Cichorium intybus]